MKAVWKFAKNVFRWKNLGILFPLYYSSIWAILTESMDISNAGRPLCRLQSSENPVLLLQHGCECQKKTGKSEDRPTIFTFLKFRSNKEENLSFFRKHFRIIKCPWLNVSALEVSRDRGNWKQSYTQQILIP